MSDSLLQAPVSVSGTPTLYKQEEEAQKTGYIWKPTCSSLDKYSAQLDDDTRLVMKFYIVRKIKSD